MPKQIILLGTHGIPANHGGFETCAEKLALYLTAQGWHVTVFGWGEATRHDVWNGITRRTLQKSRWHYLRPILYDLRAVWATLWLRGVILTFGYNTACFNLVFKLLGRRQIINMDGIEWQRPKYKRWHEIAWLKFNEWCALRIATIAIADHAAIATHLHKINPQTHLVTLPYGADLVAANTDTTALLKTWNLHARNYDLIIARPEPENSILEIVQGWITSNISGPLVILGHYEAGHVYHQAVKHTANHNVLFLGTIFDPLMVTALRVHARFYIHGHTVGGTNPSLVEAMAAGCAIIAHDNIYNRGVACDAASYFTTPQDITHILQILSHDPELALTVSQRAHARHSRLYRWEPILHHYADLLTDVQKKPG